MQVHPFQVHPFQVHPEQVHSEQVHLFVARPESRLPLPFGRLSHQANQANSPSKSKFRSWARRFRS
jgi:hypothetical protein